MKLPRKTLSALLPTWATVLLEADTLYESEGDRDASPVRAYSATDSNSPARGDVVYLDATGLGPEDLVRKLRPLRLRVQRDGALFCAVDGDFEPFDDYVRAFSQAGLGFYRGWRITPDGDLIGAMAGGPVPGTGPWIFQYQRLRYDPVAHAREYLKKQDHPRALDILQDVPDHWFTSEEERGLHATELLIGLLMEDKHYGETYRLDRFKVALHYFNRACTWVPFFNAPYICMANFWRNAGWPDRGRRLLQTVDTALQDGQVKKELASFSTEGPERVSCVPPPFDATRPLRILFMCHPESDFGSDVLHDGLRRVLGPENVVGFPWKPVLHGGDEAAATGYPCTFKWPEPEIPLDTLLRQVAEGRFDVILYSDTLGTLPRESTQALLQAAGNTPLFVVDMWDQCGNAIELVMDRDEITSVAGFFKREMLQGARYFEPTWPLLFSYPEDRIATDLSWEHREGIFWAGKRMGGARALQLDWLQKHLPLKPEVGTPYTPEEYARELQAYLMGISLPGNGFDTVRYWELPAHGTLLLSERPPLVIPHDFEDGKHAVFFDTVSELREKAEYYLEHRDEALAIAQAGHAHLLAYHTGSARARECLGHIQHRLATMDQQRTGTD